MLRACGPNLPKVLKALCDGGYSGENFANTVGVLIGAEVEAVKRSELHTFEVLPRRWVVERTLGCWKSSAVFGKTANAGYITHCKRRFSRLYRCC
jgi:transposase